MDKHTREPLPPRTLTSTEGAGLVTGEQPVREQPVVVDAATRQRSINISNCEVVAAMHRDAVVKKYIKLRGVQRQRRVIVPTIPEYFTNDACVCGKPAVIILLPCGHKASCDVCYRVTSTCPQCNNAFMYTVRTYINLA